MSASSFDDRMATADAKWSHIRGELARAVRKFPPFNSAHEGYAVMLEEFDELWEEVRRREVDIDAMRKEAIQVAAMAIRFLMDVCP